MNPTCRQWAPVALLLAVIAPVSAQTGNTAAAANPADQESIELPQFDVSANKADPYRPADVTSIARVAGSILETPLSVNVATPELIRDLGANAAFDVTKYFGGISPGRGTGAGGIMDRQDFRGFESFSKTIDNFSSFLIPTGQGFQANFDPVFIDRAELVMGPDSILSPTGTPGGSINIITKSPNATASNSFSAELGNYNAQKYSVDSTGAIDSGKRLTYRVIADYQDGKTYVPGDIRQWGVSFQLSYAFSANTKLTVKYFGEQWELTGAIANPNDNGEMVYTSNTINGATLPSSPQPGFTYGGWNGDAAWSHRIDRLNITETEFTTALTDRISMRLAANLLYDNFTQDAAYPSANPAEKWDPATGQEVSVATLNTSAISEIANFNHAMNREIQIQNDYAGNFKLNGATIQPVVGIAYQRGSQPVEYQIQDKNAADLPPADLSLGYYNPPPPPRSHYTSFSANIPEYATLYQAYGLIKAGFLDDRLFLTAGGARTWAKVADYVYSYANVPGAGIVGKVAPPQKFTFDHTGIAVAPDEKGYHDTYLAGVLYKVLPNVSTYYSFSTNAGIAQNNPVWQSGVQHEFGVKSEFFNQRLSFTAAHFQIRESNVASVNPLFNTGQSTIPQILTDETNHGVEFNLIGGITKNLSIITSYTEMHLRDPLGRRLRNVPDRMGSILLNYHFSEGWLRNASTFVAVQHVGNVAGENSGSLGVTPLGVPDQVGFYVKDWTVVNVGAAYSWSHYRFNLNIDNALDEHFWWQPASRQSVSPYPSTTIRLTTTVTF